MDNRSRIEAAILPWRTRTDRPPPFTCADLVVIALALNDEPMTDLDICLWTWTTFAFYRELGVTAVWNYWTEEQRSSSDHVLQCVGPPLPSGFYRALRSYAVPVSAVANDEGGIVREYITERDEKATSWSVEAHEAMLYLRPRLWPDEQPSGSFPFLRLPPDLRNTIYNMVFAFPPSGIKIKRHNNDRRGHIYVASRSFDQPFDFELWRSPAKPAIVGRMADCLTLLRVNRQIRSEALYIFPSINTFYFVDAVHMARSLKRMSAEHRDNIRDLAFRHIPGHCTSILVMLFEILATMRRLRTLRVFVNQEDFRQFYSFRKSTEPIVHMGFDRTPRIDYSVRVLLAGDKPPDIEKQIRSEPVPTAEPRRARIPLQPRPVRHVSVTRKGRLNLRSLFRWIWTCIVLVFLFLIL